MAKKNKQNPAELSPPKNLKEYNKYVLKGQKAYGQHDYGQALKYYTSAWQYPDYAPEILASVAQCLFRTGMRTKAIDLLRHAVAQNPENAMICMIAGNAALDMNLFDLATRFYQHYVSMCPHDIAGHNNLATALREDNKLDEAIEYLQRIIPDNPNVPDLWNTLAATVNFRDGPLAAQGFYEEALRLNPEDTRFLNNLSILYAEIGRLDDARKMAEKSISLKNKQATTHARLADILLHQREFEQAWKEYEWRNDPSNANAIIMPYKTPVWKGEDLTGKSILIGAEQGVADELLYACLHHEVIKQAEKVYIGCDQRLVDLYKNSFPDAEIAPYQAAEHKLGFRLRLYPTVDMDSVDYMIMIGSVPRYFWTSLEKIKDYSGGYLTPSKEKVDFWKHRLAELDDKPKVGIGWRSGIRYAKRLRNYATLTEWVPILKTPGVTFVNLQYDDCQAELDQIEKETGIKIINFPDLNLKDDFDGTCAMMKNLDLVMGPGTTPIIQSASVGTKVWWLANSRPFWLFGEDTPPHLKSARVYNKPLDQRWPEFMPKIADELKKWQEDR